MRKVPDSYSNIHDPKGIQQNWHTPAVYQRLTARRSVARYILVSAVLRQSLFDLLEFIQNKVILNRIRKKCENKKVWMDCRLMTTQNYWKCTWYDCNVNILGIFLLQLQFMKSRELILLGVFKQTDWKHDTF